MKIINVCLGTACNLATKCRRSEFNEEAPPPAGCWRRHYEPGRVGMHCDDFEPLHPAGWGVGGEAAD